MFLNRATQCAVLLLSRVILRRRIDSPRCRRGSKDCCCSLFDRTVISLGVKRPGRILLDIRRGCNINILLVLYSHMARLICSHPFLFSPYFLASLLLSTLAYRTMGARLL